MMPLAGEDSSLQELAQLLKEDEDVPQEYLQQLGYSNEFTQEQDQ
jgi:hypothetical protein